MFQILRHRLRRLVRGRRGQSMASYAVITWLLFFGVVVNVYLFWPKMLEAFDMYSQSIYFGINAPIP